MSPQPAQPYGTGHSADEHGRRVASMFGRIAGWYDFLNHALSLGQDVYWRHRLVRTLRLPANGVVLDLAAGTMDVTLEVLRQYPDARVLAMDFAEPMLRKGQRKAVASPRGRATQPVLADGRCLPLPQASIDAATIAFGIRNIVPRSAAFAEILQALKPGGRLCVLEFGSGQSRIWKGLYNLYLDRFLPVAGSLVSGDRDAYAYLAQTIRGFPPARELATEMRAVGFAEIYWQPLLSGIVVLHVARKAVEQG